MSYNPLTDFLGLLRRASGGVEQAQMPGLDYVVAAMARAGMFTLSVGQTAPTTNQPSTAWLKPSVPSWVAEGTVFLWNSITQSYQPATPALWTDVLAAGGYSFQSLASNVNAINTGVSLAAVQRAAPTATSIVLPSMAGQFLTGRRLQITDWSTGVVGHMITLTPSDGSLIMRQTSWQLISTADQLAGVTLRPSPDLNGWVIAP